MRKLPVFILILSFQFLAYGQAKDTSTVQSEASTSRWANMYLIIDTITIELDSITVYKIDPEWIENIIIEKDEKYRQLHVENRHGAIFIYTKKRYWKKIVNELDINQ